MEIPIYKNLNSLNNNYKIDYLDFANDKSEIRYLADLLNAHYIKLINDCFDILYKIENEFFTQESYHKIYYLRLAKNETLFNIIEKSGNSGFAGIHNALMSYLINDLLKEKREIIDIINILNDEIINTLTINKNPTIEDEEEIMVLKCSIEKSNISLIDVIKEIHKKISEFNTNTNHTQKIENEIPEYDFSDNEDKVKLIILEKLGVIDYIKSIQQKPEVISHTAEILSSFTGIKSNSLYSYLRPMISPQRDDSDKNSPYKNADNLLKANRQIHDLKINDANK